jgi:hypothetical protein
MRGVQRRWRRARTKPRTREVACQRADGGVSNGRVVVGLLLDGYLLLLLYRLLLDLSLHRRLLVLNGLLLDLSLHRRWLLVRHHRRSLVLKRIRRRRHILCLRLLALLLFRPRLELRLRLPREALCFRFFLYRPRRLFLRCEVGGHCGSACSHCTSVSRASGSGRRICRSRRRVSRSRSGGRGRRRCHRRRALILVLRPRAPVVLKLLARERVVDAALAAQALRRETRDAHVPVGRRERSVSVSMSKGVGNIIDSVE